MQVVSGGIPRCAHFCYNLAFCHLLSGRYQKLGGMAVKRRCAAAVVYNNAVAIAAVPAGRRYETLLKNYPADIVCLGIGENGHIAFNDPWVADFEDSSLVKTVPLDEICRRQQVHDGCFASLDQVPKTAVNLTVPALTAAPYLFCTVPSKTKRAAVNAAVNGEISVDCPASVLRRCQNAVLYCDGESGQDLL